MLLKDYRKLARLSLADMLAKLQAVAEPSELDAMRRSTILRHETGENFPGARMQQLYLLATDSAVGPMDHVMAHEFFDEAKADKPDEGEELSYAKA